MKTLVVGNMICGIDYRSAGEDGGPAFHLIVEVPPRTPHEQSRNHREVWRADCFRERPHAHWFTPSGEKECDLTTSDRERPVEWCVRQLGNVRKIVEDADYPEEARKVNQALFDPLLETIRQWMNEGA